MRERSDDALHVGHVAPEHGADRLDRVASDGFVDLDQAGVVDAVVLPHPLRRHVLLNILEFGFFTCIRLPPELRAHAHTRQQLLLLP